MTIELETVIHEDFFKDLKLREEDSPVVNQLKTVDYLMKKANYTTLKPLLPLLLSIKGRPYHLKDYFAFEPLFRTRLAKQLLIKSGRQVSKCVKQDSEYNFVYDAYGRRYKIMDMKPGQQIQSLDTDTLTSCLDILAFKHDNPIKPCLYLKTRRGVELEVATTHPLLTFYGWKAAAELKPGDKIVHIRQGGIFGKKKICPRRLKITAYMLGDGSYRDYNFTGKANNQAMSEMRELLEEFKEYQKKDSLAASLRVRQTHPLVEWAREDNLHGKYSYEKHVPDWVFELNRKDTITFIEKLWSTDGCITQQEGVPIITFSSTSRTLIFDLKSLLSKFDIPVSIAERQGRYKKEDDSYVECRKYWVLRVETREGWATFLDTFTVPDKPRVPLPTTESSNNRYTVPKEITSIISSIVGNVRGIRKNKQKAPSMTAYGLRQKPKYALTKAKLQEYADYLNKHYSNHPRLKEFNAYVNNNIDWDEIIEIKPIGKHKCIDIETAIYHNYVMDGIVVHNSTSLAGQGIVLSNGIPYFSTLFITPLFEQIKRFSQNYVGRFITDSPVQGLMSGITTTNNVLQRSFKNNSQMIFSFAYLDAERTRGISADKNAVDEIQDVDISFLPIIHETMSASPYALTQYTGTPKTLDNTLERLWIDTSMAEWCIKCTSGGCGHWNIPALEFDLIDMIGSYRDDISDKYPGVVCAKCRKTLNPRPTTQGGTGRWVHRKPELRWQFAGYHIPQVIMPMHYANPEKWMILLAKKEGRLNTPLYTFYNEVLGESWDTGSKLITISDLKRAATLPWERKLDEAKEHIGNYLYRFVAVDWGGGGVNQGKSDLKLQSYTTMAVCGLTPNGKVHVLYGFRSMHPHDHVREAKLVLSLMHHFKCSHVVHDYTGAGTVRETLLRQAGVPINCILPVAYVGSAASGLVVFKPATEDHPRDHYTMDRNRALNYTCQFIKSRVIEFFRYDYKGSEDPGLLHDFLSLIEDKKTSGAGRDSYKILRDPSGPDDFAQAVTMGTMMLYQMAGNWPNLAMYEDIEITDEVASVTRPTRKDWED